MSVDAVLGTERGSIIAPAGCGKTHLIVNTLRVSPIKPYLVLTHTTAGVAALKLRLRQHRVPSHHYVVSTIDGWAKRLSAMFPASCNLTETPDNARQFYPNLRQQVNSYVETGHINDLIRSTYSMLLVDEYQDCNIDQHRLICSLSECLPTIIFGDPMQCIFDFSGPMPSWNDEVQARFPLISQLEVPWRWENVGTPELGRWILDCRNRLALGQSVDLKGCPGYVNWIQLTGNYQTDVRNTTQAQYQLRNNIDTDDSLLVIGDSRNPRSRHDFASVSQGIDVVEPVELSDVIAVASEIENMSGTGLVDHVLKSLSTMMTGISRPKITQRIATIQAGRNRTPATQFELAVKAIIDIGDMRSLFHLLSCAEDDSNIRIYRKGAFFALKSAVQQCISDPSKTLKQAAEVVREQRRHQGDRRVSKRAIGSTLLLKGLEADHVLILDAGAMNTQNLYVALSRGAKSITVFSSRNFAG